MSAFICDEHTFSTIYTGMKVYGSSGVFEYSPIRYCLRNLLEQYGTLEKISEQLYALNVRAVNQKYREKTDERMPPSMVDTEWKAPPSLFQFLKSLQCLRYQMSEGNVPQEELYRQLYELIAAVSLSIVYLDRRYTEARWG